MSDQLVDEIKKIKSVFEVEQKIQHLLLDLDEELAAIGETLECIEVDTRNFANMRVNIGLARRSTK
jgi:hypothetical protein